MENTNEIQKSYDVLCLLWQSYELKRLGPERLRTGLLFYASRIGRLSTYPFKDGNSLRTLIEHDLALYDSDPRIYSYLFSLRSPNGILSHFKAILTYELQQNKQNETVNLLLRNREELLPASKTENLAGSAGLR